MSNQHLEQDLFGDSAGLVPSKPVRPLPGKSGYLGLAVVFLALTVVPGLVDTLKPLQAVIPVGEEARIESKRRQDLSWMDGSRGRWLEEQRKRRSRVRHWILPTYSVALLAGFDEVQADLLLGSDNWLFQKHRVVPSAATDEQLLQRAVDLLTVLHNASREAGHRLIVVPIPRKASLVSASLPEGVDSRPHLEDRLASKLADSDLETLDLLPALHTLYQRRGQTPYYKGDSHLACLAMLEAAEAVAHQLDGWQPEPHRPTRLHDLGWVRPRTDLLHVAGVQKSALFARFIDTTQEQRCFTVVDHQGHRVPRLVQPQETPRVAWIGTSFSAFSNVSVYLSHYIGEPVADYAAPGHHALGELQRRLDRRHLEPLPEILILEVPNYQLFDWELYRDILPLDFTPPAAASLDGRRPPGPAPSPGASKP